MTRTTAETAGEIDRILALTFEDQRLSRGERQALQKIVKAEEQTEAYLKLLRERAFHFARNRLDGVEAQAVLDWLEQIVKLVQPGLGEPRVARAYFSPRDDCARVIGELLRSTVRQVDICVFTITDNRIAEAILTAHRRKVAVRILTDQDKSSDLGSDIKRFHDAGVSVRVDRSPYHMHHKFAVFDARTLLTGSYNWTRTANEFNQENVLVTDDSHFVEAYSAVFHQLWEQGQSWSDSL
jgi:phosphatidylserine/phosphatidylglycerophosphate/cardiolipin synthase-like enzyme